MKKKVLFLYSNRPEPLPVHMMHLLEESGRHEVRLLYYARRDSPVQLPMSALVDEEKCSVVSWPVGRGRIAKAANRAMVLRMFVKMIREFRPDVVHAWNFDMLLAARMAVRRMKGTRVVYSLQDTTEWMVGNAAKALQRRVYRGVDLFFVTSRGFETEFLRKFGLIGPEKEVVFVPNVPLDAQFRDFSPRSPDNALVIGYIGLLRCAEGMRMLVEACERARGEGADVRLFFAGKGALQGEVEALAEARDWVEYHGPYQHDEDIFELYGKVDVLYGIYDRSYDKQIHLAYRFCEAVNCRLPIIVARGTHMEKLAERYGVGVVAELGDAGGLAGGLVSLWKSPERRRAIAENCNRARPEFVFEKYREEFRLAYEELGQ